MRASVFVSAGFVLSLSSTALGAPEPPTPNFGSSCDAFASYDEQDTCDPTAKPGTAGIRDFILNTYPTTGDYGITRACNIGGTSEHKEGRAWDWKVNYFNTAQRDIADTVIAWMLDKDAHGNACAIARRIGVMYFIWNKEIWGAYRSPNAQCATAGYKAYTGTNPHTDHVHISWSWPGAKKQTTWWTSPLPANVKPKGYLDGSNCKRVWGWSQDPDTPNKSIDVHLYFDGAAGDANAESTSVKASLTRDDLCTPLGSCDHAFEVASPLSLHDGQPHAVHAYGIDSAGGANAQLSQSPSTLQCDPVIPDGVRRHVVNQTSFEAWGFSSFWDVMPVADADVSALTDGPDFPSEPVLVKSDDGSPEVWLVDGEFRRHVPNTEVFETWGFDWAAVDQWPAAEVKALTIGPVLRDRPVLVQGTDAAVYLMDDAFPSSGSSGSGGSSGGGWGTGGIKSTGGVGGANAAGTGSSAPNNKTRVLSEEESGCGCRVVSDHRGSDWAWVALGLGLVGLRRRRVGRA